MRVDLRMGTCFSTPGLDYPLAKIFENRPDTSRILQQALSGALLGILAPQQPGSPWHAGPRVRERESDRLENATYARGMVLLLL